MNQQQPSPVLNEVVMRYLEQAGKVLEFAAGESIIRRGEPGNAFFVVLSGSAKVQLAGDDGTTRQCATRRLLKTLNTDQRHVVAAGDRVMFRPSHNNEGIINVSNLGMVSSVARAVDVSMFWWRMWINC